MNMYHVSVAPDTAKYILTFVLTQKSHSLNQVQCEQYYTQLSEAEAQSKDNMKNDLCFSSENIPTMIVADIMAEMSFISKSTR